MIRVDAYSRVVVDALVAEVTAYQWLVLAVASAGWIFDIFEGQIFNITRAALLADVLHVPRGHPSIDYWGDVLLGVFLVGGAIGGVMFGAIADRFGRRKSMIVTILCYAIFSGLTFFARTLWHVAVLRFLVAIGVGGEWAVAASLVAEVFPQRARANASAIFHATSVIGTWLAAGAGILVAANWRFAYLMGIAPAILVLIVRSSVREPERWQHATFSRPGLGPSSSQGAARPRRLNELFENRIYFKRALGGLLLAAVGLAGFWGVMVAGQNLAENMLHRQGVSPDAAASRAKFAYGFIQTAGGGIGLLAMGPLCARLGRRGAFVLFQLGALIITPITCFAPASYAQLLGILPIFGFFNLGMHAGYAIWFPELFPTRLRATGCGMCFNGGRLLAAPMLVLSGSINQRMNLPSAISLLALVYLIGLVVVLMLPETGGQTLAD